MPSKAEVLSVLRGNDLKKYLDLVKPIMNKGLRLLTNDYTIDQVTAESIVEESVIKMIKKIELFDENRGSFSTWGHQLIINAARDYLRKNKIEMTSLEELEEKGKELAIVEGIETKPSENVENASILKSLEFSAALSALSDPEQRVINMTLQNYSGKEAAGELRISEAALRKRKERALEKFRNILITYPHFAEYADEGVDSQT